MEIAVGDRPNGVTLVEPTGRLDLLSAGELRRRVTGLAAAGRRKIVVDLGAVTFIDSSGLGAIVGGLKAARLAGGDLRIARPNDQARVVLELTTLDRVLHPYASVDEAAAGY